MVVQWQQIPISFAGGLDTKNDPKQVIPGNFLVLENAVFTKPGSLQKRNGLDLLSQTIDFTEGEIVEGQALSTFNNQLLLFTGSEAYSRLAHNDKWTDKGSVSSIINSTYQIVRNGYAQDNPDANKVDDVECYVWEDQRGGVRYSIVDSLTGNFILADQVLNVSGSQPKVLVLHETDNTASQFVILFTVDTNLYASRIYTNALTNTPTLETVASDMHENQIYDACACQGVRYVDGYAQAEFNRIFVTYAARYNSSFVYTNPRTYKIDETTIQLFSYDFTVNTSTTPLHIAVAPAPDVSFSLASEFGPTSVVLWDDGYNLNLAKIPYYIGPLTSVSITLPAIFELDQINKMTLLWDGQPFNDQIGLKLFFEFNDPNGNSNLQYCRSADLAATVHGEIFATGTMDNVVLKKGIGIYSKPFFHNNNIYITMVHDSTFQPVYFVMNDMLQVVSKINQELAGTLRSSVPCEVILDGYSFGNDITNTFTSTEVTQTPVGNGIFRLPCLKKGKIESEDNTIFSKLGITRSSLDFISPNHFISANINDNLYVVGGVLQNYDGNKFTEAGFHLYPENVELGISQLIKIVTTTGDGTHAQVNRLFLIPGSRITPGSYFTVSAALDVIKYALWFRVDGVGTDPAPAGYNSLQVNIKSYFTATQVAIAVKSVLDLCPEFVVVRSGSDLTITNISNGATEGILLGTVGFGGIAAGTYSYVVVWKYIDNAGRTHRSTTSIPQQVIVPISNTSVSVTVPILSPTSKEKVIMEVYRTENLGDLYRRVTFINNPTFNIDNSDPNYTSVTFIDITSDADAAANELLYTTGNVLDNNSPPPCSLIAVYKNRLFIAGLDDKNLLQYSKLIDPSDKEGIAGFNDALFIEMDTRGGDITALATMDDKLVIFKETQIFFISGDGPSNTGDGGFGDPQLISTDVGCNNPNSVVLMPNGLLFKSPKGIYQLGRDLNVQYIGSAVESFNDLTISSSILLDKVNQVRFTTEDGSCLVFDYYVNKWTTFTNYESVDCDIYGGKFTLLRSDGKVQQENSTSFQDEVESGIYQAIKMAAETADIAAAGLEGFQRIRRVLVLGEYKGTHTMKVSLAYDYDPDFTDDATFDAEDVIGSNTYGSIGPYGTSHGGFYGGSYTPYLFRIHLSQQKCTALRVRLEDIQTENFNEGLVISGISLEVGMKKGPIKLPADRSLGSS